MMVSLDEAHQIYKSRCKRIVMEPVKKPTHLTKKQIRNAVTKVKLMKEEII